MVFATEAFKAFAFYASLLLFKMFAMSFLTAFQRLTRKVFANPEDLVDRKKDKVIFGDENVERVRRAHLNDIENILPFFMVGFLYCTTNPVAATASLIFKVFTIARYVHTFVYAVYVVPQPARALSWFVGMIINFYLTYAVCSHYCSS